MFRTSRAYFCQTVVEGSPLSRVTSKLFNRARQSIEGLFRGPVRSEGIVSKQPVVREYGGKASIVAQIHSNSRGILTRYLERHRTYELVNTVKQRFGWRSAIRGGVWSQRLSAFAFVGVGVAAGAQWNTFDEEFVLQHALPNIMELFKAKIESADKLSPVTEPETHVADFEFGMPLNLSEDQEDTESSVTLLHCFSFVESDDNLSHEATEETSEEHLIPIVEEILLASDFDPQPYIRLLNEEEERVLKNQLSIGLQKVEEQRAELDSLRAAVQQLNAALHQLLNSMEESEHTDQPSLISEPDIESINDADIVLSDDREEDVRERLIQTLSLVEQQQLQMSSLKQHLVKQNQQLQEIYKSTADKPITVQRFSTRDACCGPGSDKFM